MKNLAPFILLLAICFSSNAQVGINTIEPTATLDVNGGLRVRGVKNFTESNNLEAKKIIGIDELGNFVEVEIDKNVILENNKLSALDRTVEFASSTNNIPVLSDLNLILLPGEVNERASVIRMSSILPFMFLTGIMPGVDGQTIWLYPTTSDLTILPNSILSLFGNRIEGSTNFVVKRYEMLQLMYDGSRNKWIPMANGL
ncbi:hypothetical protein [Ulvibacter litoralis]|uniref:Uncharacterized protein n=1 Tax=Ulvibacter litoralis TaxID=227084 RepID=A0A1G7ILQ7_9FLAO|nr:hypothetical protein [Ulvibacter litoralis]GHC61219.1 hypothetical protein GCM10008083_27920 [Ulvibacter litoralis]SDF13484.1 hypothetical protein SAMN05421855_10671 [Ulvibacter litoralis]